MSQANVTNAHNPLPSKRTAHEKGAIRISAEGLALGKSFTVSGVKRKTVTTRLREVSMEFGREFAVAILAGGFQVTRTR